MMSVVMVLYIQWELPLKTINATALYEPVMLFTDISAYDSRALYARHRRTYYNSVVNKFME